MKARPGITSGSCVPLQCKLLLQCLASSGASLVCTGTFLVWKYLKVAASALQKKGLCAQRPLFFPDGPRKDISSYKHVFSHFWNWSSKHSRFSFLFHLPSHLTKAEWLSKCRTFIWRTCFPEDFSFHHLGEDDEAPLATPPEGSWSLQFWNISPFPSWCC